MPLPLAGAFDYRVPDGLELERGHVVRVPLGVREVNGVVWDAGAAGAAGAGAPDEARLREIVARLDVPPLEPALLEFVDWVARYTVSPPGTVLRMVLSVPQALQPPTPRIAYGLGATEPKRMTPARRRVLGLAAASAPRAAVELAAAAGVSTAVVRGLADSGALHRLTLPEGAGARTSEGRGVAPVLSPAQAAAAANLLCRVAADSYSVTLLDGVTGAGKTEVYFEAAAAALEAGRQVLVLLPEIALSAQWLARFEARFGTAPFEWHSDLRASERRATWRAVAQGRAKVVVGARSALFLPLPRLGLIVVDEEHDGAFKQEDGVIYNARDMAIVRAYLGGFPIVLVSATPSLETLVNAESERYGRLHLPDRHGGAELPHIAALDLRRDAPPAGRWLAPALVEALGETVAAGEQAMLFLNRRGYAPLTLCRACGHRLECPNCSAWLVEHRFAGRLVCHHCGHTAAPPKLCPECGAEGRLAACGPGVERLAEEVGALLPEARLTIMASDTLASPKAAAAVVRQVTDREIDILIGTQIMAKGHHFPHLTLVGVVDADLGLSGGDLRASERTYQLLVQVSGRAGRAAHPGRVLLQTYMPEHPVMQALLSGDAERFLAREAEERRARRLPPFGRLAALIVSGANEERVRATARALGAASPQGAQLRVLGPAPAPLSLIRGRHRQRLLLSAAREVNVPDVLRAWLARVKPAAGVRIQVDVDPYSFL